MTAGFCWRVVVQNAELPGTELREPIGMEGRAARPIAILGKSGGIMHIRESCSSVRRIDHGE